MKYKVGDIVKLRDDLEDYYGGHYYGYSTEELKTGPFKITEANEYYYTLDDMYDWGITDEMIEGLWEENKPKYKLIDILNKISNGELKEGTKFMYRNNVHKYRDGLLLNTSNLDSFDIADRADLNMELQLIEPNDFADDGKMAEPTDNTKIKELNVKGLCEIFEGKHTVNPNLAFSTALNKLNEVIRKLNKEEEIC